MIDRISLDVFCCIILEFLVLPDYCTLKNVNKQFSTIFHKHRVSQLLIDTTENMKQLEIDPHLTAKKCTLSRINMNDTARRSKEMYPFAKTIKEATINKCSLPNGLYFQNVETLTVVGGKSLSNMWINFHTLKSLHLRAVVTMDLIQIIDQCPILEDLCIVPVVYTADLRTVYTSRRTNTLERLSITWSVFGRRNLAQTLLRIPHKKMKVTYPSRFRINLFGMPPRFWNVCFPLLAPCIDLDLANISHCCRQFISDLCNSTTLRHLTLRIANMSLIQTSGKFLRNLVMTKLERIPKCDVHVICKIKWYQFHDELLEILQYIACINKTRENCVSFAFVITLYPRRSKPDEIKQFILNQFAKMRDAAAVATNCEISLTFDNGWCGESKIVHDEIVKQLTTMNCSKN